MWNIYIAGPISDPDKKEVIKNVERAMEVGYALIKLGYAVYLPHLFYFIDEHVRDMLVPQFPIGDGYLIQDLTWLEMCDAMYRLPGESKGTPVECKHAEELAIPIFTNLNDLLSAFPITE